MTGTRFGNRGYKNESNREFHSRLRRAYTNRNREFHSRIMGTRLGNRGYKDGSLIIANSIRAQTAARFGNHGYNDQESQIVSVNSIRAKNVTANSIRAKKIR